MELRVRNKKTGKESTVNVSIEDADAAKAHVERTSPELEVVGDKPQKVKAEK